MNCSIATDPFCFWYPPSKSSRHKSAPLDFLSVTKQDLTPHTQTKKGSIEAEVPFCEADDRSPPRSPDQNGPPLQDIVGEIRKLLVCSMTNGDACVKSLNEFGQVLRTGTGDILGPAIFEQRVSDQKLQHELIATTQKLVNARLALQQATAACDALRREVTAERDRPNGMAVQLKECREANLGFVKVISELSQGLHTVTALPAVASGGLDARGNVACGKAVPRNRDG